MATKKISNHEQLRGILLADRKLNLELTAAMARLLREYGYNVADEVLSNATIASAKELVSMAPGEGGPAQMD